ncbi:MAG: hypothetical protein EAZ42_02250 [Verrucomicrobia bacterium]|nr:MAG: hypothetical protein EAZ42_02250 [Verrucomicrobiota bacterium]
MEGIGRLCDLVLPKQTMIRYLPILLLPFTLSTAIAADRIMNFNSVNLPANTEFQITNPWIEDGMVLTCSNFSNANFSDLVIRNSDNFGYKTGVKSPSARWNAARFFFHHVTDTPGFYRPFTMKSIRLFPMGGASTVTFLGIKTNGDPQVTVTFNTGNSLSGTTHQFPANFEALGILRWTVNNNNAGLGYHQFDDLVSELAPTISVPQTLTLSEGSGVSNITLEREAGSTGTITLTPTISGTASSSADYTSSLLPSNSVEFTGSNSTASFTFQPLPDTANESPETVIITWPTSPNYVLSHPTTTITIGDTNGSGFADYMSGHGVTGNDALASADPNSDGISNIESYLHRINPAGTSPSTWLARRASYVTAAGNVPALQMTIPTPLPNDVRLIFQESPQMDSWSEQTRRSGFASGSSWTGTGASRVIESNNFAARTITLPSSQNATSRPAAFLRMKYELITGGGSSE